MISKITGRLAQLHEQSALVENSGLYYEVLLPSALAERLRNGGQVGHEIEFDTIYYIEAGDKKSNHYPKLVGFTNPIDREFFSLFTQVPGLGVKKALKSLVLPVNEIAAAIETKDSDKLRRLPGVGGRLAEKIVAELHGKTAKFALAKHSEPLAARETTTPAFVEEAMAILEQLQYSAVEAKQMIDLVMEQKPKINRAEDLISLVFKAGRQLRDGEA
jgi:Holliday junction DNA helicase RuvA